MSECRKRTDSCPSMDMERSFTLVELLVVITIISILAGMLLPVLKKAKDSALKVNCLSNLKQIGTGVTLYTGDYHSYVPGYYNMKYVGANTEYWTHRLRPYIGYRGSLFICPASFSNELAKRDAADNRKLSVSAFTSLLFYGQTIAINGVNATNGAFWRPHKLSRIHNSTTLIYAADTPGYSNTLYANRANQSTARFCWRYVWPNMSDYTLYPRHMGGINILFVDGHAECVGKWQAQVWADTYYSDPASKYRWRIR